MKKLYLTCFFFLFQHCLFAQDVRNVIDSLAKISPSQDVIIFVNGFWGKKKYSPANCGKECYWQFDSIQFKPKNAWNYNQSQCLLFFQEAFRYFNTSKIFFVDGGDFPPYTRAQVRQRKGRNWAETNIDSLINRFQLTDSAKVHFVSHSMGAAYSEGIIDVFLKRKKFKIGKIVHLAASEAGDIKTKRTVNGPEKRIQIISQGDKVVEQVNRYHRYKKDNLTTMIQDCDIFACFYENEITRPQAGDIGHALHLRKFAFDIIKDLERLSIQYINKNDEIRDNSNYVPYRKVMKNGCEVSQ